MTDSEKKIRENDKIHKEITKKQQNWSKSHRKHKFCPIIMKIYEF